MRFFDRIKAMEGVGSLAGPLFAAAQGSGWLARVTPLFRGAV